MTTRTTLFLSNRSQALQLPKVVAFGGSVREVMNVRDGPRRIIIIPSDAVWDDFFEAPEADLGDHEQPAVPDPHPGGKRLVGVLTRPDVADHGCAVMTSKVRQIATPLCPGTISQAKSFASDRICVDATLKGRSTTDG